ncbi:hypothetical protein V5P93_007174 [Actinokineospora auranticolor]|uniref:Lipoprotein n=1 Tax=Actinokineospora auranticolor TaxID=155976 RepID=A0A2S6GRG4_9PSEU|nr:hypothetical protein [Actinokineospora auranticolor]PPK67832.1 hypothetical protein CLV40_10662 [Actinokineospora auranticolor]
MRRAAALLGLSALVLAGCAKTEPAAVPPALPGTADPLLAAVGVKAAYQAETCGSVFDDPNSSQVVAWADVPAGGVTGEDLRKAGIRLGWQPQAAATGFDVFLLGPGDVKVALRSGKIRVERARCSIAGKGQELDVPGLRPELTDKQREELDSSDFRATVAAARGLFGQADPPVDEEVFPRSAKLEDAPRLALETCGDKVRGARWVNTTKGRLRDFPDPVDAKRAAVEFLKIDWEVDERPAQPDFLKAEHEGGTEVSVTFKQETTFTATGPCVLVN